MRAASTINADGTAGGSRISFGRGFHKGAIRSERWGARTESDGAGGGQLGYRAHAVRVDAANVTEREPFGKNGLAE